MARHLVAQPDLFAGDPIWRSDPMAAFESLVKSGEYATTDSSGRTAELKLRANSLQVYRTMFGRFLSYLTQQFGVEFVSASAHHVGCFFESAVTKVSKETAWRYVRLLERVYEALVNKGALTTGNPVTAWVQARREAGETPRVGRENAPPVLVSRAIVWHLQDWLYTRGVSELDRGLWRAARDTTLASVSLGAGLRSAELLKLKKDRVKHWPNSEPSSRFEFDIPRHCSVDTSKTHQTMADETCADLLDRWWSARWNETWVRFPSKQQDGSTPKPQPIPGDVVFPGTLKGEAMDASTLYRNLKRLSVDAVAAGVLTEQTQWLLGRGAQGLRRAYVLSELEAGQQDQLLRYRLGVWSKDAVQRYRDQIVDGQRAAAS